MEESKQTGKETQFTDEIGLRDLELQVNPLHWVTRISGSPCLMACDGGQVGEKARLIHPLPSMVPRSGENF